MPQPKAGTPHLIRDCVLAVVASAISIGALSWLLASWYSGTWKPFDSGQDLPWEALGRIAIPLTALFAAIVGAVIAGHGQSAKLRELKNAEDANVTERFTNALDQLATENENVRIGGIYALERIGHDSERDRKTIVSILRTNLYRSEPKPTVTGSTSALIPTFTRTNEVEAALAIALMRLRRPGERDELASYLIQGMSIEGADLSEAYLVNRWFTGVYLAETSFRGSDCREASFQATIIYRADFRNASLQATRFLNADLTEADFRMADLREADFRGAMLDDVDFRGANLRGAKLTGGQLLKLKKPLNKWEAKARGIVVCKPLDPAPKAANSSPDRKTATTAKPKSAPSRPKRRTQSRPPSRPAQSRPKRRSQSRPPKVT